MLRVSSRIAAGAFLAVMLTGCAVGPNYKRPAISSPQTYRGDTTAPPSDTSFGDEKWPEVFQDPQLQALIRKALQQNYDVRIAATRIAQAQAQLGITRSDEFPSAAAAVIGNGSRNAASKFVGAYDNSYTEVGLGFQWNLDFWGKYRRATEAARDQLLATNWAQREVIISLVANVASAYYTVSELDLEDQISRQTLASDQDSLKLTQLLSDHGRTSLLDVRQAEQQVFAASGAIPEIKKQSEQQEDLISTLIGDNPEDVTRGMALTAQVRLPEVPPGLPSSLLERRPDIREAEAQLMSMNAQIGVAKAAYFPSISLTGTGGTQSIALSKLFTGPAGMWSFTGQLLQPLYTGGALKNGVRLAQAQEQQAALTYQQTIQEAFREVSDALIAYANDQEFTKQQQLLTTSAQDASQLSDMRYKGGVSSYLEVLDADTRYYVAEVTLARAQLAELLDYVQLYRALGGGWEQ